MEKSAYGTTSTTTSISEKLKLQVLNEIGGAVLNGAAPGLDKQSLYDSLREIVIFNSKLKI